MAGYQPLTISLSATGELTVHLVPARKDLDDVVVVGYSTQKEKILLFRFWQRVKIVAQRSFDKSRQYLWPIPDVEIRVNPKLKQNPRY